MATRMVHEYEIGIIIFTKFLERIQQSDNKFIKAFNEGVRAEVELSQKIGDAEFTKRMASYKKGTQPYLDAEDAAFKAGRLAAELEVKNRRGLVASELSKIANRLSKLDGAWGWSKRAFGAVAKHTPIVVTGYVYYTEGDIGRALAESTPLSWSLEGSRALGAFYEYVEQEIEDTAFENHYSEGLWMKLAHSRQGQYERAKAQRDFERDCNRD